MTQNTHKGASQRLFQSLGRALSAAVEAMNALATIWIFGLLLLINADIFGRFAFAAPVRGTAELIVLSIVGIVFLQMPSTLRHGRLSVADSLFRILRARRPRVASFIQGIYDLTGAATFAIIYHVSVPQFQSAWRDGLYVGTLGDFTAPTWPIKLIILIGCVAMTVLFLARAAQNFWAAFPGHTGDKPDRATTT